MSPEFIGVLKEVLLEKVGDSADHLKQPKWLSGQRKLRKAGVMKTRQLLVAATLCMLGVAIADLASGSIRLPLPVPALCVLCSTALGAILVTEIFSGAGAEVQDEFSSGADFYREYRFEPSVANLGPLLGMITAFVAGLVAGFGDLFLVLSANNSSAYSETLDGLTAVYFSLVTFATVGYGDVHPVSTAARLAVMGEILLAFFTVTVILGTVIAWGLTQRQARMQGEEQRKRRIVEEREAFMKNAGIGLYGDNTELLQEVVRRAKKRGIPTPSIPGVEESSQ